MFWRFGGYANISTIDTLLDKPDVTLEELLDESDLIQELKSHNTKLIEFLREDAVLEKLLEYVVAPKLEPVVSEEEAEDQEKGKDVENEEYVPKSRLGSEEDEDEREKKRNRYAYVSAEILSSESWSLSAALLENQTLLRKFWDFLKLPPPLDPLQASYFTKVNEALLDKKTEEMLELFKSIDGVVKNMLQHVDSPMVMDLLLKIISLEKAAGGQGIVDWLHSQDLMPILLSFLSAEHSWATQTSAGDFLKAIITISANASQTEQSCIGPNELTRQLVSQGCVEKLIADMLKGGNPLTVGVGIVIEVIRKNNSDYDPDPGAEANTAPSSRDPIYLGTLLRLFAKHVPDFMALILSPNHTVGGGDGPVTVKRKELRAAFGNKIEPLGFDRFKTCELMAELLHCSNMCLLNEPGSDEFVKARDIERERARAEGKLAESNARRGSENDDLTMRSSTAGRRRHGSHSPDAIRRLEVQNASDDDGFEQVTHSGDLADDPKDDFDEKPDMDDLPTPTNAESLSFMDKDDEDFVDEPLSSPRLNPDAQHFQSEFTPDPSLVVLPLSPTKDISNQTAHVSLDKEADLESSSIEKEIVTDPVVVTASTVEDATLQDLETLVEVNIPLSVETLPEKTTSESLSAPVAVEAHELSPHPEDKPAPLFAKKVDADTNSEDAPPLPDRPATSSDDPTPTEAVVPNTMDVGDDTSSILVSNSEEASRPAAAEEPNAEPVVGDYLKMQFVAHGVVPTIIDFFFRFPWNNFLHNVVYDVVQQVFNGPMDRGYNRTLAIDLFDTGNISMRIVDGQKKSDEAQEKDRMRLGYMGHLTLIAEEVVKFTERHPPELLSDSVLEKVMNGEWITYVEMTLAETRERDNAILGGVRPDLSVGPRQAVMNAVNAASGNFSSGSSALAEAGLNGGAGLEGLDLQNGTSSGTGFMLTGQSLLSGFGSSSDEEDEEMEEEGDEEGSRNHSGAEFSRYITTPSTTTAATGSESEPPLAPPPPPPPLNTPSAARRRLAARLALHSKQNTENSTSSNGDAAEHAKNINPFATDEDDDEDEQEDFTLGDLEAEAEGKGILPPGTAMAGQQVPLDKLGLEFEGGGLNDHVGSPEPILSTEPRKVISSVWPFGQSNRADPEEEPSGTDRERRRWRGRRARQRMGLFDNLNEVSADNRSHNNGASANLNSSQSSDDNSSDDSDEDFDSHAGAGIVGASNGKKRRPSTTEAKRRTSLEDDDEDGDGEVVHVAKEGTGAPDETYEEIQHAEMNDLHKS